MEEPEERDASRGVSELTAAVGEHVADENLVDSEVSVSKGQVEGSLSEEAGRVEGGDGACNGEDIMVEVLGSDVYVDGVCTNRTGGNSDEDGPGCSTGIEPSVERDGKSPGGDAGDVSEPDLGVSDGIANDGVQSTVEGESGVGESIEKISQEVGEDSDRAVDAMVLDDEDRTDDSSIVAGPRDRETESIHAEEEDVASKEAMDVEVSQVSSDQGSPFHNSPDDKVLNTEASQKIEVHPEQSNNSITDNGFGDDLVHAGGESQIVTEEAPVTDGGEAPGKGQVVEIVEEGKQLVDSGVDTPVDLKNKKLEISDADAWNPVIKPSSSSADGNENSNSRGQDATEKAPDMPEDISRSDGSEISNLEKDQSHIVETEQEDTGKDDRIDDQSQAAGGVELASNILINGQKITCAEQPGLCAWPKSVGVPKTAVKALGGENLNPAMGVPENVAIDSVSSIQANEMNDGAVVAAANDSTISSSNIEVSAVNEHNLNAPIECRHMESCSQANGQGAIPMTVEQAKNVVDDSTLADFENVEEMGIEQSNNLNQVCLHGEEEMEDVTDINNGDDQIVKCAAVDPDSSIKVLRARYQLPSENEGDYSVSDLVWGKVRSHPWWPGQIFDPCDSSERAMKYYKKDFFLVAYFGDRTFAWNEVSHLKPFRTYFSQEEIQSNSEAFQNAVECALEEVSRRAELGLACACTPREAYDMIKCQIVENAGIREESSRRYGVDMSASVRSFEPAKLIEYIRDLARFPSDGSDRLELVIAKAQLTAFYRLKGYCSLPQFQFCGLPQFQFCGGLVDNDSDTSGTEMQSSDFVQHAAPPCQDNAQTFSCHENLKGQSSSYHKRKHNLKDGLYPKKKERSLSELMGETFDNLDGENWSDGKTTTTLASPSAKKRKTVDYPTDDSSIPDGRKSISFAKVSSTAPLKQSFKIGDCIRRVASQLTGTPPIVKSNNERFHKSDGGFDGHAGFESDVLLQNFDDAQRGRVNFPTEYSSLDELLSQLQLVARDPMKEYSFLNLIVSFFADFRDSIILRQHSGIEDLATDKVSSKRKTPFTNIVPSPETFEFEDMSDTYWTDRVIQNGTEVQPSRRARKREYQVALVEPEKSPQGSRRPYKKRHSTGNHAMTAEKFAVSVNEPSPAELIMNFSEVDSVPSEKTLNSMFRRFGPLRESETEVDREGGRARVVFKKSSDAEIAFGSAGRFNIFGPRLVNYQLSYSPSTLFKASPIPRLQDQEMHLDLSATQFQDMQLDLASFHDHEMQLDLSSIHDQEMQLDLSTIEYQEMESVLDPHHHQESKPCYTSTQLGEMQADFSTIQYERQPDLPSTHAQDLQTVFAPNQEESQSVSIASQNQELELQHNFTSIQLGEIQAHHALSHHDEPSISASAQEQEMQPVFATIKVEKMQPALDPLQEEETQSVLATIQEQDTPTQLCEMQADLDPIHHEKQIVSATTQEYEMQPVIAMIPEGRQPVLDTVQEEEKDVHSTTQELEMQPVVATIQEERQPEQATIQEERQPELATIQEQEKEVPATTHEHEMEIPATACEQEMEIPATTHEQEMEIPATTHEQEMEIPATTHEQEMEIPATTQELMIQEERQAVLATVQEQEKEVATTQETMIQEERQPVPATVQEQEKEAVIASPIHHEEKQPGSATTKEQDMQPVLAPIQANEMLPVLTSTQDQQTQPLTTSQELVGEPIPGMTGGQETHDLPLMEEHETEHVLATIPQATQSVTITAHEQEDVQPLVSTGEGIQEETEPILGSTQELETQSDLASTQELEPDQDAMQGQELPSDHVTTEHATVPDCLTSEVQEVQSDHATGLEQDVLLDNSSNEVSEMQCESGTNQEQDRQCGNNANQEQEMQCDDTANEQGMLSGDASEQDMQSDHEQDMQTDDAMNQEQEKQSNFATLHEQDMQSDRAEKHTTQDQVMQPDLSTFPDSETRPDIAPTKDQEMQLGLSSLEKNTV